MDVITGTLGLAIIVGVIALGMNILGGKNDQACRTHATNLHVFDGNVGLMQQAAANQNREVMEDKRHGGNLSMVQAFEKDRVIHFELTEMGNYRHLEATLDPSKGVLESGNKIIEKCKAGEITSKATNLRWGEGPDTIKARADVALAESGGKKAFYQAVAAMATSEKKAAKDEEPMRLVIKVETSSADPAPAEKEKTGKDAASTPPGTGKKKTTK